VIIEGNKVRWSGNNGIQVFRSTIGGDSSIVTMNTIGNTSANSGGTGPNGNAITVFRANYVTVSENKIFSSAFSAIRLNSSSGSQASASKYGAIVPVSYDATTGDVTRISGSTDLGNATSSGFANVKIFLNFSFT
jgi:hypothetical protein